MKYTLTLKRPGALETYEKNRDNVATVDVRGKNGKLIKNCTVKLYLSKNAMLGLGKSLIRYAHEQGGMSSPLHFYRLQRGEDLMENLGIFIATESVEPIIGEDVFKTIDEIIDSTSKGLKNDL